MKVKNVPIFEDSVSETQYALYYPAKKNYVQSSKVALRRDDGSAITDTRTDPKLIMNESTVRNWQFMYAIHGLETEVVQIKTTVEKIKIPPQTNIIEHLCIIQKQLCRNDNNYCLDGGKLFEAFSKDHHRYLVFYMENYLFFRSGSPNDKMKKQIDFIKNTVGKKTKCWMIDLYSEVSHKAVFFFSNDLTSNALLKIIGEGKVAIYDTEEKKFL